MGEGPRQMAHPIPPAEQAARNAPAAPSEPLQHGARPMTADEITRITPKTTEAHRLRLPHVSPLGARKPLSENQKTVLIAAGIVGAAAGALAGAVYLDATSHPQHDFSKTPIIQEGQSPTSDTTLRITNPNDTETQTGDPMVEIQNMLKADVNEFYNGTISLDNPTFTAVDPEHPNSQQIVSLSQIEELCGVSLPQDSHLDIQLSNVLISSNKTDGTMKLVMDGMVNGKKVVLETPWGPKTIKTVIQGLFINTKITGFTDGEPVVSDQDGNPQTGNQIVVVLIDDQPSDAQLGQ